MSDIEKALKIGKAAIEAIEIVEAAAQAALDAARHEKGKISSALAELHQMTDRIQSDRTSADNALDEKFR